MDAQVSSDTVASGALAAFPYDPSKVRDAMFRILQILARVADQSVEQIRQEDGVIVRHTAYLALSTLLGRGLISACKRGHWKNCASHYSLTAKGRRLLTRCAAT